MKQRQLLVGRSGVVLLLAGTLAPWLMEKYGEKARQARSGALHAAKQTPDALFEVMSAEDLTGPSPRAPIFTQWLSWTAVIFYRWRFSAFHDYDEYARGVAQLLLLSTPDEGGRTFHCLVCSPVLSHLARGTSLHAPVR